MISSENHFFFLRKEIVLNHSGTKTDLANAHINAAKRIFANKYLTEMSKK